MNSGVNWELQVDPGIYKTLKRIPLGEAQKILEVLSQLAQNPYFGDLQKIKGEKNVWRRRVGSYRIFFEIYPKEKVVYVFHLERRTTSTY